MNYADQASDLSSMSASATSEILNNATNSISTNMTNVLTGATTFKEGMSNIFTSLGESVIQSLIQMATQALITKAILASVGGGFGGIFGSIFGGASGAASSGTAIQSAGANFSFNALGGVYDSPSLSAYSGGVYNTPQYFAFAKGAGVYLARPGRKPSCRLPVALMVRWGSELLGGNLRRYRTLRGSSRKENFFQLAISTSITTSRVNRMM